MSEMNKEQFEQMLGSDAVDRLNYIELLDESMDFIEQHAVFGLMLMALVTDVEAIIEEGHGDKLTEVVQRLSALHMSILGDYTSGVVQKHFNNINGRRINMDDITGRNTSDRVMKYFKERFGFDPMEIIGNTEDDEEE
jgi:hypothetical protein